MSRAWQFWTGNAVNPAAEHYRRVIEEYRKEEEVLAAREKEVAAHGPEIAAKYRIKFIGTTRRHEPGTSIPKNPKLQWMVPPKRIIWLGFEIESMRGTAGWRVGKALADWVPLSGKLHSGWTIWLEEKDVNKLPEIWRKPDLPPVEKRFVPQADGTLANFGGHYRIMGASGNSQFWVVCPDGSLREPDTDVGRGYGQKYKGSEGDKLWNFIAPEELAIFWSKSGQHAGHVFKVWYRPNNGLTEAQKATVNRLQEEIASFWEGRVTGNDNLSPSMGKGWGLTTPTYRQITKTGLLEPSKALTTTGPATLADLMSKFNGR